METGDERVLASRVRTVRRRRGLSQADLAEMAGLSTKTIQRLEVGRSVGPSSRGAVLGALGIDPEELARNAPPDPEPVTLTWTAVRDAAVLIDSLAAASRIEVELDREAVQRERRQRPWYLQTLVIAARNPIDQILEIVDRAGELSALPPGRAARERDELAGALTGAGELGWGLATRVDERGELTLYLGAPREVRRRVRTAAPSRPPRNDGTQSAG